MERKTDDFCEKILMLLMSSNDKIRFNELYRKLARYGVKISKPTLIEHLNHLIEQELILREEEGKQKVTYTVNWNRFKQVKKAKEMNPLISRQREMEKNFKIKSLEEQTAFTTAMVTIGELFYLKLKILDILEPENKLHNYVSYTFIRRLYNIYATWLVDSCNESKENSKKVIKAINKVLRTLHEELFEIDKEAKKAPTKIENSLLDFQS